MNRKVDQKLHGDVPAIPSYMCWRLDKRLVGDRVLKAGYKFEDYSELWFRKVSDGKFHFETLEKDILICSIQMR